MKLRDALKEQYHAGMAMLTECVHKCPDDTWPSGKHPRAFWRIVFHAVFYTHLYAGKNESALKSWPGRKEGIHPGLWEDPSRVEPYELPEVAPIYGKSEMLDYIRYVDSQLDALLDEVDFDSDDSGIPWYPNIGKLSHELMNLRHLQGHVGQLSELLMARGIDTDWVAKG